MCRFITCHVLQVLSKSARRHLDRDVEEEENLLECQNHPGKMVDMYCSEHDEIWCGGCMAIYHKTCSNVVFISEAAKPIMKSKELKDTRSGVIKTIKEYAQLKQRVERNMDNIAKQSDATLETIKSLRMRINDVLEQLERGAMVQLKEIYTRNSVQISEDVLRCEAVLKALSQVDRELNKPLSPSNLEPDIFVYMHRAQEKMKMASNYFGLLERGTVGERIRFVIEPEIEDWLYKMKNRHLGHFIYKYRLNEIPVRMDDEVTTCVINGASVITDERILMTDWSNKRLKLLDKFFAVTDCLNLESGPNDVCHVSTNEAMVSLPDEKSLQLVKIDPKLSLGKKYDIGVECRGMEYWAGELYVICGGLEHEVKGHLRVYNTTGKLIRAIEHDHLNEPIFSIPMRMAISNDGSKIYVTDGEKGIITLKKSGEVLPPFQDAALKWPWGISADNSDQLFVCGSSSNNVVQIRDNSKIGVALQGVDGIKDPMAICFFPVGSKLIVTTDKNDYIKVFTPL
ncbi:uncharacterized protein LOC127847961 [Dreissena polymorpha]|uniref:uncharacterized protein LOC127847961 n=1 Tax=Dreissena polymorpha TaxID=45954 RepID=UPI002265688F|nr:uncharacterized protein LOC127847961 [Dreissena polymorpha]